jgi:hypothetical protein
MGPCMCSAVGAAVVSIDGMSSSRKGLAMASKDMQKVCYVDSVCKGKGNDAKIGKTYRCRRTGQNNAVTEVYNDGNAHDREQRRNIVMVEK